MKKFLALVPLRRTVLLCGIVPVILTAALAVYRPGFLTRLDDVVYDSMIRAAKPPPTGNRVVIVDVDERSLSTMGQWPWRRDLLGELIGRLRGMGASTVALDVVFAETDRSGNVPDDAFAETLREGRVVLGYAMTFDRAARPATPCVLHPVGLAVLHPREDTNDAPFFRATGAVCTLPRLSQAAGASGFLNAAPDSDGILRRAPLLVELDGRIYPSLALAAVAKATDAHDMALRITNANVSSLSIDDGVVPVDGKSNLLLRYRGKKRTFTYVSAGDVMTGGVPDGTFRNKIVFVGTTALGTREVVATPLDTLFAGVEVQATVADNLLERDFNQRSPLGSMLESQVVLVLGIALAVFLARTGVVPGVIGAGVSIVALWSATVWLLSTSGVFVSPLSPTIGVISALAVMTLGKVAFERQRADTADRARSDAQRLMVQTLLSLTETRDAETGRHSRRTQQYARLLSEQLSAHPDFREFLTADRIDLLSSLAPLHDIGKVGIPDQVLNKPGALTPEELVQMRRHPELGLEVILRAEQQVGVKDDVILAMAKDIVYTHHEKWDGSGYPRGLRGNEIPIAGRVMAVVDVYDATSTRTLYRPSLSHDDTVKLIVSGKGTHFDPTVVEAFVQVARVFEHVAHEADHEIVILPSASAQNPATA